MSPQTRPTKNLRWETRVDEELDSLAAQAAAALGLTPAAFVREAVRDRAERTLARADVTLMDAELFDELIATLDVPDDAPALEKLAALPRRFRRV